MTRLVLAAEEQGRSVLDAAMEQVYDELYRLASIYLRGERAGHTLSSTALVHEAFLRLVDQDRVQWNGKAHFLGVAALCMRRILVNHARDRVAQKRGGDLCRVTLATSDWVTEQHYDDLLALDQALDRLAAIDARQAEVVVLRFFADLGFREIAETLGIAESTARLDWSLARAWLTLQLGDEGPGREN